MQGFTAHITPGGKFLDFSLCKSKGGSSSLRAVCSLQGLVWAPWAPGFGRIPAEGFAYGAPEDGGGRLSLRGWRAWAWKKRRADLARRFAVIRFSLRGPSGMGGQRRAAVGAARQARVVWLMTSSTKLSSRFCRPSPISKRVKLTTRNLPPIICWTDLS